MTTARARVAAVLREIGLQCRPSPDVPDRDWERWLAYFQDGYTPPEALGRCSWCGGKLVKRSGRYGDFAGCSNYPNCTFTRDLEATRAIQRHLRERERT